MEEDFAAAKQTKSHLDDWGSGIYFLMRDGVVVYVGKALCILRRVLDHYCPCEYERNQKDFDEVRYINYPKDKLTEIERYWIAHFLPEYNRCSYSNSLRKKRVYGCRILGT